jgi:hypothetical protein
VEGRGGGVEGVGYRIGLIGSTGVCKGYSENKGKRHVGSRADPPTH